MPYNLNSTDLQEDLRIKAAELAVSRVNYAGTIYILYRLITADGKAKVAYEGRLDLEKFKSVFARKTDALFYEIKALTTLLGAYHQ